MRGNSEMESMLGFNENLQDDVVEDKKLVPWMSWDEWKFVRGSLFSSSPNAVASALKRISTWRSRGCIPVAVEVTASIIEIQQQDPYFMNELNDGCSESEEMLSMLYCMAIVRQVILFSFSDFSFLWALCITI
ncbi:las1-like family protein [Striga asiatica]|uniref:Las1-like family protein n=1 Tax=Striga asiatica TaxID=4170 RepID=A0A5A7RDT6_STRAF|nr:las1-like family protein [Striga asiatica]